MENSLTKFENKIIRKIWHKDEWWFSVVDIIEALTDSPSPRQYWGVLKSREPQLLTICLQLKLPAEDNRLRYTDCANTEGSFRIIQSIPSKRAEPFKLWLAKVGYERIQEIRDPELSVNRARENWKKLRFNQEWIQKRMMGQETRNKLTDYWKDHEITKDDEFAILTNMIHEEWAGVSIEDHKKLKGIEKQNLRDSMDEAELIFTALAEFSTREIAESITATGFSENKLASKDGGKIAKNTRKQLESKTGKDLITEKKLLPLKKNLKK